MSAAFTPMLLPACDQHGQMELQPAGTPEQAYCGIWYRCTHCTNTELLPSTALVSSIDFSKPAWPTQSTPEEITRANAVPYMDAQERRAAIAKVQGGAA